MSASGAKKCFIENRNLFGNHQTQPEKFNLYNGLASLAEAVEALEGQLRQVQYDLQHIKNGMR